MNHAVFGENPAYQLLPDNFCQNRFYNKITNIQSMGHQKCAKHQVVKKKKIQTVIQSFLKTYAWSSIL